MRICDASRDVFWEGPETGRVWSKNFDQIDTKSQTFLNLWSL